MRVALDATYSIDPHPSGIAVYSRELLAGLARIYPGDHFFHCYRPKQFRSAPAPALANVRRRLLLPPLPTFRAEVFHALNQRVDRRPARRVVTTFHDLFVMTANYSSPEFKARFSEQARRAAQNSDCIIAVSQFTADQVHSLLQFDRSRIRVIPHGVHLPSLEAPAERDKIVLFVGAIQTRKNIIRLVDAFAALPQDWKLVLAGAQHGYGAIETFQHIEQTAYSDRIRVIGYLPRAELEELYLRSSIFAFPSLDEGFGIPVLEAMAYGVPVITSKRGALEEVAGEAAILIDPEQTEELAEALRRVASESELRMGMTLRGRERAGLFSWEDAVCKTHAVYEEQLTS